jgi:hypothetical protein
VIGLSGDRSDEEVGDLLDLQEVGLAEYFVALFKHEEALPDDCAFPDCQSLDDIFILPNGVPQRPEADLLPARPTKHHQTTHPDLIDVDVQQLPTHDVPLIVKIKKCTIISQHINLLQSS